MKYQMSKEELGLFLLTDRFDGNKFVFYDEKIF
jgi:hypothetical protein